MKENKNISIFFHIGLGKTGTTYLQYKVFPKFREIHYTQRTGFYKAKKIIARGRHSNFLFSREFDQQLEDRVKALSADFPDATPIIVFRRHDSYIASQFRRFVKNGFTGSFTDFFDLEHDKGFFKKHHLDYCRQVEFLEKHFTQKPIVLIYEDLLRDPKAFIQNFTRLVGATVNTDKIDFSKKHASYSEKQLKAMQGLSKYINMKKRRIFSNGALHFLWRLYLGSIRYSILFIARFIPQKYFRPEPLINPGELAAVKKYYQQDWEKIKQIAEEFYPGRLTEQSEIIISEKT